jgi:hypothetical protein
MRRDERVDPVADGCIGKSEQIRVHGDFVTESRPFLIRRLTGGTPRAYSQRDVSCHADLGLDLAQRAWRERRLT